MILSGIQCGQVDVDPLAVIYISAWDDFLNRSDTNGYTGSLNSSCLRGSGNKT